MPLTPRQRVLTALQHEEPDRVPLVIGASNATGIKMGAFRRLKQRLNVQAQERFLYDWPELGTADPDEATLVRLGSDVRGIHDCLPQETRQRNRDRPPHTPFFDDWGIGQVETQPGIWFPGIHPLREAHSIEELERYPWPDPNDPSRVAGVRERAQRLAQADQYAILGAPWLLFPLERAFALQGMDRFLMNMASNPEFAQALLLKTASLCKALMKNFLRELGNNVDIIKIGDDLGTQVSLLISPRMYRRLLKPIHADYIAFIKKHTHARVFFHSDGDVFDLVEDFIEIGVDILNPIQTSAGKMADLAELKKRYGKHICFCGAIDTQHILPNGSPEQVRREVRRVVEALAPGGGYLLAAVHTIPDETPPENILAMVDAAQEFGRYPIRP